VQSSKYVFEFGARGETRTHDTGFAIRRLGRLATRAVLKNEGCKMNDKKVIHPSSFIPHPLFLERKERFELSKQVWKTCMLPATSLPRDIPIAEWQLPISVFGFVVGEVVLFGTRV
jgi:hypothetical protein